jgi:hypothetical protein
MESPDVYPLVITLVKIEAELRMVANHPEKYAPDGHHEKIANLLTLLLAEVDSWVERPPGDQRQQQRRQQLERRVDTRRSGEERREELPTSESVA